MHSPDTAQTSHRPTERTASPGAGAEVDVRVVADLAASLRANIGHVLVGKDDSIDALFVALLCEGHALIEDVPGVGKTTLARAMAVSIGGDFRRIQFTPDVLPSDIGGISYFDQRVGDFRFRAGPVFANVVLADEINRATPRTQSALLEAMEERTVTVDGETRPLPRPFLVMATENPIELEGTFPLPEAQLDRFLLRLDMGYPTHAEEDLILERHRTESPLAQLQAVTTPEALLAAAMAARDVRTTPEILHYVTTITRATRSHDALDLGASPRASIALHRAAQAWAAIHGRSYVLPDDVKRLAPAVLGHRLTLAPDARLRGRTVAATLAEILATAPVPVEGSVGLALDESPMNRRLRGLA